MAFYRTTDGGIAFVGTTDHGFSGHVMNGFPNYMDWDERGKVTDHSLAGEPGADLLLDQEVSREAGLKVRAQAKSYSEWFHPRVPVTIRSLAAGLRLAARPTSPIHIRRGARCV